MRLRNKDTLVGKGFESSQSSNDSIDFGSFASQVGLTTNFKLN